MFGDFFWWYTTGRRTNFSTEASLMKLFIRSIKNGQTLYTSCDGMTEEVVRNLMTDLGHSGIELLEESEFNASLPTVQV